MVMPRARRGAYDFLPDYVAESMRRDPTLRRNLLVLESIRAYQTTIWQDNDGHQAPDNNFTRTLWTIIERMHEEHQKVLSELLKELTPIMSEEGVSPLARWGTASTNR